MKRFLCLVVLVAVSSLPIVAEVKSRTGEPAPEVKARHDKTAEIQRFESPMVLEISVPGLASLEPKSPALEILELKDYVCQGVSIPIMTLKASPQRRGAVLLDGRIIFAVEPGIDMRTDLRVDLLNGDQLVGQQRLDNEKTEEGKRHTAYVNFQMHQDEYHDLQKGQPNLRLTMTTREDP